ncbi:MAG TPA: TIGR03936 family radical SAM-associated protein [Thermotogota bacterium]|nr:TIGR03936 family radical SAM-associated protein [Thermotogota bacterium]HRW93456.1 TIGR03936 family radical SAM-associated protein [Thermotogota bacterium]
MTHTLSDPALWKKHDHVDFDVYFFKASKTGVLRFLSHLEWARSLERAMRRAQLDMWVSKGFHPKVKFDFLRVLPTGFSSQAIYFCVRLNRKEFPEEGCNLVERVNRHVPKGLRVHWGMRVFDTFSPAKFSKYWAFRAVLQAPQTLEGSIREWFGAFLQENPALQRFFVMQYRGGFWFLDWVHEESSWLDIRVGFERWFGSPTPDLFFLVHHREVYWEIEPEVSLDSMLEKSDENNGETRSDRG